MHRTATARWTGPATEGSGRLDAPSGALSGTPFAFEARFRNADGTAGTTPEELLAAAHAACYAMSLGYALEVAGTPSERLEVQAAVTLGSIDGGFAITGIHLTVDASVPGVSAEDLAETARAAKALCPLGLALNAVPVTLDIRTS